MTRRWAEAPLWAWSLFVAASLLLLGLSLSGRIGVSPYEATGFTTGLASVWLMKVDSPVNWPVGIVNAGAYAVLFFRDRLYGDGSLNVVFLLSGLLGWIWWTRRGPVAVPGIRRATGVERLVGSLVSLAGAAALTPYFIHLGNPAPLLDSATTALSLFGQWLLMRRALENWWLWIAADLVYVPLYLSRGFRLTALLFALYLVLAALGEREWRAKLRA